MDFANLFFKWNKLRDKVIKCENCSLAKSREKVVIDELKKENFLFLMGEAPGRYEDESGVPFVGKAGEHLTRFLKLSGLKRAEVYISNTVKCRPIKISPKGTKSNRKPKVGEIKACSSWLDAEIDLIKPQVIVTLGNTPLARITNKKNITIGKYHGKPFWAEQYNLKVFPLYHPAAVIYDNKKLEPYEKDMLALKKWLKTGCKI